MQLSPSEARHSPRKMDTSPALDNFTVVETDLGRLEDLSIVV